MFLKGKKALITGIAGKKSIAYGIAVAMKNQGAELVLTYQERLKDRVVDIANEIGIGAIEMDVSSAENLKKAKSDLKQYWDSFDILIHSIAFAPKEELEGDFLEKTTKEGFMLAHDISSYSFVALAQNFQDMINPNGSLLSLSYIGSVRAIPNYNIMGVAKASLEANIRYMAVSLGKKNIRVNGISAGPIKTLAAMGIKDFRKLYDKAAQTTALGRNVTIEEVGNTAAFLCSDLASGITGEITYVDAGFNFISASL